MGKKGTRKPRQPVGDPNDPEGLYCWMRRYLEAMRVKNYSERTVENRESYLGFFILWCEARSITRPQEATKPIIDRYQRHLFHMRKPSGKPLSFSAQSARLVPVRGFFKWLTRQNVLLWNPASEIELPKQEKRLPKHVLTATEAEAVMMVPHVADPIGLRDRAILETLYSTGIRRMEVINLTVFDLDQERGTLMVRQGKGKKDRMVPIGERAVIWIGKYLDQARPKLVLPPDPGTLFLTQEGEEISTHRLTQLVRDYVKAAETGKSGACHLFRHTCATLMLEGGADIRYIQEMLGHVELSTTQIYTQVSIRRLKAVHSLTHPAAKVDRPERVDGEEDVLDDAVKQADDETNAIARPPLNPEDAKSALFATLATEAETDDAIDDEGEAVEPGDEADRRAATEQAPTAP
jgi:integrase/recombinase XerD